MISRTPCTTSQLVFFVACVTSALLLLGVLGRVNQHLSRFKVVEEPRDERGVTIDHCIWSPKRNPPRTDRRSQQQSAEITLAKYQGASDAFALTFLKSFFRASRIAGPRAGTNNFVFSPFAIWQAMTLAYILADHDLSTEMELKLGLSQVGKVLLIYVLFSFNVLLQIHTQI